jgi:erythromycin esterase
LKALCLVLLAPLLLAAAPPDRAALEWLERNAVPIRSVEPDSQGPDLAALSGIVSDARIAGFGEATHGSREFFRFKDRAFRHLVREAGFRGFAIEANFAPAERIDDWIKGGDGDPEALVAGLGFWTWDTEEVLALVRWMRHHNDRNAEKLSFFGVDIQHATPNLEIALSYMERHAPAVSHRPAFAAFMAAATDQRAGYRHMASLPAADARALRVAAEAMLRDLEAEAETLRAASGPDAYLAAVSAATAAGWYFVMEGPRADRRFRNLKSGYDIRDRAMADLSRLALQRVGDNGRLFVWGHNAHVANDRFEGDRMTMGQFLKEELGSGYVSIGFSFDRGTFQAFPPADPASPGAVPRLSVMELGPAPADHSEALLRRIRHSQWIADLRLVKPGQPAYAWFLAERPFRWTGSSYSPELMQRHKPTSLSRQFDALVFLEQTSRARPLRTTRERQGILKDW